jgi:hypothetical protein
MVKQKRYIAKRKDPCAKIRNMLTFNYNENAKELKVYVFMPNKTFENHLKKVKEDMKEMGSPIIKCIEIDCALYALEGSHRITAAHELSVNIQVELMSENEMMEHDFQDIESPALISDLFQFLNESEHCYKFDYDRETQILSV